jgi:hypothetical protein
MQRAPVAAERGEATVGWFTAILHEPMAIGGLLASLELDGSLEHEVRVLAQEVVAVRWRQAQRQPPPAPRRPSP